MLVFLLATLLHINQINFSGDLLNEKQDIQQKVIFQLEEATYNSPYHIIRPLPPIAKSEWSRPTLPITAKSAIVVDDISGQVLWQKNVSAVMPIASLTKLVSALVFLDTQPDFNQEITIEESDNSQVEGSRLYVVPGEKMTVGDLFYTSLVGSANNATKALARSTGLSEQEFLTRMNKKAETWGLQNTEFFDVTGLNPANQSTVFEYSVVARQAFSNSLIIQALGKDEYEFVTIDQENKHRIRNTNKLLNDNSLSLIGAKTGYLREAGFTFVCRSEKDDHSILIVLFNSSSAEARFTEAKNLTLWAYENFIWL